MASIALSRSVLIIKKMSQLPGIHSSHLNLFLKKSQDDDNRAPNYDSQLFPGFPF